MGEGGGQLVMMVTDDCLWLSSLESTPIKNTYFNRPGIEASDLAAAALMEEFCAEVGSEFVGAALQM